MSEYVLTVFPNTNISDITESIYLIFDNNDYQIVIINDILLYWFESTLEFSEMLTYIEGSLLDKVLMYSLTKSENVYLKIPKSYVAYDDEVIKKNKTNDLVSLDDILDKISKSGVDSLSEIEKNNLKKYSI